MKIAIKEWAKCPKACWELVLYLVIDILYVVINAKVVMQISDVVDHYNELTSYIVPVIISCVATTCLYAGAAYLKKQALAETYTSTCNRFADKVAKVDYNTFTKYSCSRIITLSENMRAIVSTLYVAIDGIICVMQLGVLVGSIYRIDPTVVVPIVVVYLVAGLVFRYLLTKFSAQHAARTKLMKVRNKELDEMINAFAEVRSFCTAKSHISSIRRQNDGILQAVGNVNAMHVIIYILIDGVDCVGLLLVLFYVSRGLTMGLTTAAAAMSLVMYVWRISQPMSVIAELADRYSECTAMSKDFAEFMAIPDEETGDIELKEFDGMIEFDNVSFSYMDTENVLQGINLTIKKGEKVGICGTSGGGKSTLLKLLPAFYRNFDGMIRVNGVDVRKLESDSLRSKIGFVHQDNHIFDTSIYDNIAYGCPDATMDDVVDACKKASIYDFIQSLPDKFNTNVGPKGLKLSGGQKQRISLARIFLSKADIILLDEATSALDNESEAIVQESLQLFEGKTIITVAHRLTTIRECDKIVVIDDHKVAEIGTHDELLTAHGIYASLCRS